MISLGLIVMMCASYFVDAIFIAWLFNLTVPKFHLKRALLSVALIAACISSAYIATDLIPDIEIGNRFQHAFGGGFTAFLSCYLAYRDAQLAVSRFRFVALGLLIVTAMGVGNEILEFALQTHTHFIFADNTLDTWRDLASNTLGATIAAILLVPWKRAS